MDIYNKNGFTLLEVLESLLILVVGFLAIAPLVGIAIHGDILPDGANSANVIAQKEVELLLKYNDYSILPFISTTESIGGIFDVYRVVEDATTNPSVPPGVYNIRVTVSWTDQKNVSRSVFYSTLKAKM